MPRFSNLLGAVPLIAWYLWGLWQQVPVFVKRLATLGAGNQIGALFALQTVAQAASIAFISLLIILLVVRDAPRTRARGFAPYVTTMFGTFAVTAFFFLPVATRTAPILAIATFLIIVGFGFSVCTLIYLGRSFAILPSARVLVTDGPYRFVRHPLYLFEEIAVVGIMLQFVQPWSLLLVATHLAAQLARMHYEEQALAEAFPEYAVYAARTARLIPGVY